jgi:hypothetical protein
MPSTQAGFHFINGMVAEVDDSSITIRRGASFVIANQRNFKAAVSDDSLIYLDGKSAELDDLNLSTTKVAGFWEPGLLRFIDSCFIGPAFLAGRSYRASTGYPRSPCSSFSDRH